MPPASRIAIRGALVWYVLGATLGATVLLEHAGAPWRLGYLVAAHVDIMLVGWMIQLALGVAFWLFPRHGTGPPHGRLGPVYAGLACLNAGVVFSTIAIRSDGLLLRSASSTS